MKTKNNKMSKKKKVLIILLSIIPALVLLYFLVCTALFFFEPVTFDATDISNDVFYTQYTLFDKSKNDKLYIKQIKGDMIELIPGSKSVGYIKNTLLLTTENDVTFENVEKLASEEGASICGYIECAGVYQLEYPEMSYEELCEKCEELKSKDMVKTAIPDYNEIEPDMGEESVQDINNDIEIFNSEDAEIKNSALEECKNRSDEIMDYINADEAWKYSDSFDEVKIGVLDGSVDYTHFDLDVANASDYTESYINDDAVLIDNTHGTHVGGIIAAKHNGIGNDGICETAQLYSYSVSQKSLAYWIASMCKMIHYDKVRAINISYGYWDDVLISASMGDENALAYIEEETEIMESVLGRLLDNGDDYLLCVAAGNSNMAKCYRNFSGYFGYGEKALLGKLDMLSIFSSTKGKADAQYGYWYQGITTPEIKDRIIVVGAYDSNVAEDGETETKSVANYSVNGERIDIVAPSGIYSTILKNSYKRSNGTSMSAPVVTGTAAMLYAVDDSLTGADVKKIIVSTSSETIQNDFGELTYPAIDAGAAVSSVAKK